MKMFVLVTALAACGSDPAPVYECGTTMLVKLEGAACRIDADGLAIDDATKCPNVDEYGGGYAGLCTNNDDGTVTIRDTYQLGKVRGVMVEVDRTVPGVAFPCEFRSCE